ncbi:carboxymethylenebutenolidase [Plakobranchus ocellatus]|uniref:Carboxymethylenebutenolidase n=1 Tax=Plakobranchus ocellatus TaxID=259542 RepID=A0AAV3YT96_9GAST|nr:carboxymethylenebutenolidase [Plakobranchus ocellatus]
MPRSSYNLTRAPKKEDKIVQTKQFSKMDALSQTSVECPSENKAGPVPAILTGNPKTTQSGIIVLQEWWGLNDQIRDCGKDISVGAKTVTIVPDLYRGKMTTDNEEAGHLMGNLDWQGAVADIRACAKYLKKLGCKKVGVTGFCMGGALAFAGAALVPEIDAAAPFYGIPGSQLCDVTTIKIPVQCHFAEKDDTKGFASPDEWKPLKTKLEANLEHLEFHSYNAPHAFTSKISPNYNRVCQELAFKRMFKFFKRNLAEEATSTSKKVECTSENKAGPVPAILTGDPKTTPRGIIVLQEWWGLNDQIQDCGRDISVGAKAVTIVPDLYRGKMTTDHEEAGHFMNDLDWLGAVADIRACAIYLKEQGCKKVGVTGFCMGGALAFAGAALVPEIDAAAPFYGIPGSQLCDVTTIKIPVQCHFAEKDDTKGFASPDEWKPLKTKLKAKLKDLQFHSYDAPHAFTSKISPNYNQACQELAFKRMFEFFAKNLEEKSTTSCSCSIYESASLSRQQNLLETFTKARLKRLKFHRNVAQSAFRQRRRIEDTIKPLVRMLNKV